MTRSDDIGKLILRLALGIFVLLHGLYKISHGVGPITGMLEQHGLPAWFAYGAYIGEVVAPVLLIAGVLTRLAGAVVAVNMLTAFSLAHMGQISQFNAQGGWQLELQGMFLATAIAIALLGAGRFSIGGPAGRFN